MALTETEQQVLELLKVHPMATQEALASKLSTNRSTIAGHIRNLKKKGYIIGRKYVISDEQPVTVIGGTNIDIKGIASDNLMHYTSNPGKTKVSYGGVAKNIVHNLALLDIPVSLISAVGRDSHGESIIQELKHAGVNTNYIIQSQTHPTSTYLAILNEDYNLEMAIADMDVLSDVSPQALAQCEQLLSQSSMVVLDTNIPEDTLKTTLDFCHNRHVKVGVEPVSTAKAAKLLPHLSKIHTITPNIHELEILSGTSIRTSKDVRRAALFLKAKGVENVFVTMGDEGIYGLTEDFEGTISPPKVKIADTTGAGDGFMAGLVYGYYHHLSVLHQIQAGLGVAAATLETTNSVNPRLSTESLNLEIIECEDE